MKVELAVAHLHIVKINLDRAAAGERRQLEVERASGPSGAADQRHPGRGRYEAGERREVRHPRLAEVEPRLSLEAGELGELQVARRGHHDQAVADDVGLLRRAAPDAELPEVHPPLRLVTVLVARHLETALDVARDVELERPRRVVVLAELDLRAGLKGALDEADLAGDLGRVVVELQPALGRQRREPGAAARHPARHLDGGGDVSERRQPALLQVWEARHCELGRAGERFAERQVAGAERAVAEFDRRAGELDLPGRQMQRERPSRLRRGGDPEALDPDLAHVGGFVAGDPDRPSRHGRRPREEAVREAESPATRSRDRALPVSIVVIPQRARSEARAPG